MRPRGPAGLVLAALLLWACGAATAPSAEPLPTSVPVAGRAEALGFVLDVTLPSQTWSSGDEIIVATTLTWAGPAPKADLWGSGSGAVTTAFDEIGGAGRSMGAGGDDACFSTTYARGVAVPIRIGKTAGWDGGDPNAAFYEAWARDPVLHLPAGRWRLTVGVDGALNDCGGPPVRMRIPFEILVR